jgi:hypothetical protein
MCIPVEAIRGYAYNWREYSFALCWAISVGYAHIKMNWVYTLDEIKKAEEELNDRK